VATVPELPAPIVLSLPDLPSEVELSRSVAEALAIAASVVLDQHQGQGDLDAATVDDGEGLKAAQIRRVGVDDRARDTYADAQEATEEGAEAIALRVAKHTLGRVVFRRLPKGTGADYLMRDPCARSADAYERLECSGIAEGTESASARLRSKLAQLARFPDHPPGRAVVTHFRTKPVDIRVGSFFR
jgi:hypothetical protein